MPGRLAVLGGGGRLVRAAGTHREGGLLFLMTMIVTSSYLDSAPFRDGAAVRERFARPVLQLRILAALGLALEE
jgi:hypothetical protein